MSKRLHGQSQSSQSPTVSAANQFQSRPFGESSEHDRQPDDHDRAIETPNLQTQRRPTHHLGQMPILQRKLTVGEPNDQYEQEADRVADQVLAMSAPPIQREAEEDDLQMKPNAPGLIQREQVDDDELQMKSIASTITPLIQREQLDDDELQMKPIAPSLIQREQADDDELQMKSTPGLPISLIQREQSPEEEDALQRKPSLQRSGTANNTATDNSLENRINQSQHGGSPLPDAVRSFMEPRFGTDFSQVRVHTDSNAVQLNRDLNAQAFAHKQNIYFGAGKSPGNDALTAHELTHVVQQAGSVARKPEHTVATTAPTPSVSRMQLPQPIQRMATPMIQRYQESVSVPNMGSGIGPSTVKIGPAYATVDAATPALSPSPSFLQFDGRLLESAILTEDTASGTVDFHVFETAEINNMVLNDRQWASWDGVVPFNVSGDQVTFGGPIINADPGGSGATMSVSVGSGTTPAGGYVTFALTVASAGSTSMGGGIGVGPISASAPVTGTTNFAGGLTRTFTVNLHTTPPREIAGPDVSFRVGSARLEEGQEAVISSWFESLSTTNKEAVRNGRRTIAISGYASTTGRHRHNRNLSEQRARVVERILRGHVGSSAVLNIFFFGEDNTTTPDEREDPTWRRATIVAQAPSRTGPRTPGP